MCWKEDPRQREKAAGGCAALGVTAGAQSTPVGCSAMRCSCIPPRAILQQQDGRSGEGWGLLVCSSPMG